VTSLSSLASEINFKPPCLNGRDSASAFANPGCIKAMQLGTCTVFTVPPLLSQSERVREGNAGHLLMPTNIAATIWWSGPGVVLPRTRNSHDITRPDYDINQFEAHGETVTVAFPRIAYGQLKDCWRNKCIVDEIRVF
jgi:hypothetical protein